MIPNPRAGQEGEPDTKVEPVQVIPFRIAVKEGVGSYFQPIESMFTSPVYGEFSGIVRDILIDFAGPVLNTQLTSSGAVMPDTPDDVPAGNLIPQRIKLTGNGIGPIIERLQNRTEEVERRLDELGITDPAQRDIILGAAMALNDEKCTVVARWTRLAIGQFFPEWIFASFCSSETCSLPSGLTCEPVVKKEAIAHITVLRWDCCWSLEDNRWVFLCGWRKVRIALIGRCRCGCGVFFQGDGFSYEVGIGKPSVISYEEEDPQ